MARGSWGYTGGRDYGYPDAGGGGAYGGRAPAYQVPELGAPAEALNSITELAKMMKERRDKQEKAAREAEIEFRRVTVDVPQGFVVAAGQRVGGIDTPEKKTATAWEAQRAWNEEKDRQKHSAEQSRMIEASRKELEQSQEEVRKEGQKRRSDLMKLEADRQGDLAKYQREQQKFGVRASQARDRDTLAAAQQGLKYDPAASTFYEQAPDMPTRTVYKYDLDWNIIGSEQLPVTDPRNFIRVRAPGYDETQGAPAVMAEKERGGRAFAGHEEDADLSDRYGSRPGGREELPGGEPVLPPARRPAAAPPAAATSYAGAEPTEAAPTGRPKSRFDVIREGVLAKKAKEEQKAQEGEDKAWNVSFQKAENALRAQEAQYKKVMVDPNRTKETDPGISIPTPDEAIRAAWDFTQGQPPTAAEIRSGKVGYRIPKRMEPPQVPGVAAPAAHVPTLTPEEGEHGKTVFDKQWEEGVTMGLEKERAAGRDPEAYLLRMESSKYGPEIAQIQAQARRIAKQQGQVKGNEFLQRMGELQKTKEEAGQFEPGTYEKAAAWTARLGIPLAVGGVTSLIPVVGPFAAGPAGAAAGVYGEQLAREIEGAPEMTGREQALTGALGLIGAGGTGQAVGKALTGTAIKRAAAEAAAYGGLAGGLGSYAMPLAGEKPREAGLGEIATGTAVGAGMGGVLGAGLSAFAAKFMGPKAAKATAALAENDPEIQRLVTEALPSVTGQPKGYVPQSLEEIATALGQLSPDDPAAQALRERMHVLAAEAGPGGLPRGPGDVGFESYEPAPQSWEPGFIGPQQATMEQRLAGARGAAPDLLAQLTEEAGNVPGSSRFIGPMPRELPPAQPGEPGFIGPREAQVAGAAPEGLALQPGLRTGSEALLDPNISAQAKAAAQKAEIDALVAKKPWMREGRGEEAALIGEELQGPLQEGQTYPLIPGQGETTPSGLLLPEGVRPPSAKAVARAGETRQPGSQEHFNLWLAENHRITPERWDEMLQSPDATAQVDQLISAYNASNKQAPEVPSFAGFLESKGINKGEWDRLLQSEAPDATAKVDAIINEYNETAGFADQGGPNPLLENAPMAQEPVAGRLQEARAAEGKARGSQLGLSEDVSNQIEYLQNEAQDILERRQSVGMEPPSEEFPQGRAGGGRKVVRGQQPEQIKADTDRLARINQQINQLTAQARKGREVTPPQAAVPTLQVNAQLARTNAALDAAAAALERGGVTTQKRFPNEVGKAGKEINIPGEPQNVPRSEFDILLGKAENEVGSLRAAAVATKNVPEVTNAIKAAAQEAEIKLSKLKKVPDVGKGNQRPTMAIRNTAEALGITREGLARNPQDRTLQTRARMLEDRLADLVNQGQQNRYRATRAGDKYFVMRDETPAGKPAEGKVPRTKERAIAGPFKDADQAAQFAAELEARWDDVRLARRGGFEGAPIPEPTLPKGAPPVKGQKKAGLKQVPVTEFADQRALERAEKLAVTELQHEWATAGRAAPGGRWEFPGQVPEPGLGKSKAVAAGAVPRKLRAEFTRAGQLGKIKEALRAMKLRKAQGLEPPSPFEQAPTAPRPSGGGATAEFLGIPTMARKVGDVASSRFVKALISGPRHTLRVLTEDFGHAGTKLAQKVLNYQDRKFELSGRWQNELGQALDLLKTDQHKQDFRRALEGVHGPLAPNVQDAVSRVRPILDEVAKLAETNARFAKYLNDYFPHYALKNPEFAEKAQILAKNLWNSAEHRARMEGLGATSAIDPAAISYAGSQMLKPHVGGGVLAKNAHLERARGAVARPYREDPEVLAQYFDAAARSIAQAETWDRELATAGGGVMRERLGGLFDQLEEVRSANPGKGDRVAGLQAALERELGAHDPSRPPDVWDKNLADTRDFIASSRLALSTITQTGSISDTVNAMGYGAGKTALKAMASDTAERNAVRAGSVSSRYERAARETAKALHGAGGTGEASLVGKLTRGHKWIGPDAAWMDSMVAVDRKQRIGADAAARAALPEFIQELGAKPGLIGPFKPKASTQRLMNSMSISEQLQQEIARLDPRMVQRHLNGQSVPRETERVIDAFARRMTDFVQQRPTPANLPPSWSKESGRWLTMFMPFGLRQTQNMLAQLRARPARSIASIPLYIAMGGLVSAAKAIASGYGFVGQNDKDRSWADKLQTVLSNRQIAPDSWQDVVLRTVQAYLATGPKPFGVQMGERLERGTESTGEAAKTALGVAAAPLEPYAAMGRAFTGSGQPENMTRSQYLLHGLGAAAGHVLLPSTLSYQLGRELLPPEGSVSKKFRPSHKPGWVGRLFDLPEEAKRIGALEAAKNALFGGITGEEKYLSAARTKRKLDVEKNKKVMKKAAERAERKRNYVPQTLPTYGGGT